MINSLRLRQIRPLDQLTLRQIYADAIESQGSNLYTEEQIQAWSALAWLPGVLDRPLAEGKGWLSYESAEVAAFAIRYPSNRLALLYCRGIYTRRGHASNLLRYIEDEARFEGQKYLFTEASLFSYKLLLRLEWKINKSEKITIGGVNFNRFLMYKDLNN